MDRIQQKSETNGIGPLVGGWNSRETSSDPLRRTSGLRNVNAKQRPDFEPVLSFYPSENPVLIEGRTR